MRGRLHIYCWGGLQIGIAFLGGNLAMCIKCLKNRSHLVIPLVVPYSTEVIPMDTEMYIQRIHIVSDREKQTV